MNEFGFWKRQSGFIIFKSAYMEKKMTTAVTWKYLKQSNKFKTEKLSISNIHSHRVKCPKLFNDGLITTWYFPQMFQSRFTVFNWLNIMESELPSKKNSSNKMKVLDDMSMCIWVCFQQMRFLFASHVLIWHFWRKKQLNVEGQSQSKNKIKSHHLKIIIQKA